ncbi:MAG: TonB family protein [Candidatus Eremiobacteraeota bacterium]|nr:TonB family protein [Candidatus Eremiobacteraeota bacterium]
MIAAFALAAAVAPATPPPPCRTATAALRRAESDWTAFRNGDFVDDPAGAEAHRRAAAKELAQADAAAKHCPHDATGAERAGLHYEMQLVEARRRARAQGLPEPVVPPPPPAPAQGNAACAQPDLPPHPLGAISPVVLDQSRLHRPHGTTAITVLVGPGGNVLGTFVAASSGDPVLDQAVSDAARLVAYAPARAGCTPVQGEYRFTYAFPQQ